MHTAQPVASALRRSLAPSTPTSCVCHSKQKMALFANGSRDSKSGLTWKLTPMYVFFFPAGCLFCFIRMTQIHQFFYCFQDVAHEIAGELQANPDLIIGNYSDGNLVACLLAHKLGVTHVCILSLCSIPYLSLFSIVSYHNSYCLIHSVPLPMHLRKPSTPTLTFTGRNLRITTTSPASSQLT